MTQLFSDFEASEELAILASAQHYNRRQRNEGSFVLVDKKGRFGRWNKKKGRAIFKHDDVSEAPFYSYNAILQIWQLIGMKEANSIKMRFRHAKDGLVLA